MRSLVEVPAEPCGPGGLGLFGLGGRSESELSDFQRVEKWREISTAS